MHDLNNQLVFLMSFCGYITIYEKFQQFTEFFFLNNIHIHLYIFVKAREALIIYIKNPRKKKKTFASIEAIFFFFLNCIEKKLKIFTSRFKNNFIIYSTEEKIIIRY